MPLNFANSLGIHFLWGGPPLRSVKKKPALGASFDQCNAKLKGNYHPFLSALNKYPPPCWSQNIGMPGHQFWRQAFFLKILDQIQYPIIAISKKSFVQSCWNPDTVIEILHNAICSFFQWGYCNPHFNTTISVIFHLFCNFLHFPPTDHNL